MEVQKLIKVSLLGVLVFLILSKGYCQKSNIEIKVNDTTALTIKADFVKKISMKVDSSDLVNIIYYQNGSIRNIFIKQSPSKYLKLGFNYTGILISQSAYSLIEDTIVAHGQHYHFADDGNLSHVYTYKNGILNGSYKSYYSNGLLESSGFYSNGLRARKWITYSKKGIITKIENL